MERLLVLGLIAFLFCSGCIAQSGGSAPPAAPEGFVKLAILGTNVNLRQLPQAGGNVVAQANTGDVFFAEQWPIVNAVDKSQWYRLVFAVKDGGIVPLSSADKRFKAGFFPFVSATLANVTPVTLEEDAKAREIPYRAGFGYGLGNNLPDIVRKFGDGKIEREFDPKSLEYFGIDNTLFATVSLPGLPEAFLWEAIERPYEILGKSFTVTKPGLVFDGIALGTPGFGREEVRALMKKKWKKMKPDISQQENGERWFYSAEMWNCEFIFDEQGLVKSYSYYFTTG